MSDAEQKTDRKPVLISSPKQLRRKPKLRDEYVDFSDWETIDDGCARFRVCELSAGEHAECVDAGYTYKDGARVSFNDKDSDFRWLSFVLRDEHDNRIWPSVADAKAFFQDAPRGDILALVQAGNRVNAAKRGNSETTQSE